MENKWLWLLILLSLCVPAKAVARPKKHKSHKVWFSAHRDSVLLENMAAGALHRYLTQAEVDAAVSDGTLVALYGNYMVSSKLPDNRRYALPTTEAFVGQLANEFYFTFQERFMVDSAVRAATTQTKLLRTNKSAAPAYGELASTHERGTTVDISKKLTKAQRQWLVVRLLYYRAIGRVLLIQEKACYHVFVMP